MEPDLDCPTTPKTPMPEGYQFVPKGNSYVTQHCRTQAHAEGKPVYIVYGKEGRLGIRVPTSIYIKVLQEYDRTKANRARKSRLVDARLEEALGKSVKNQFYQIPPKDLREIVQRTTKRKSGRIGRSKKLDIAVRARLATYAHIRHRHTGYEKLLKKGVSRDVARYLVDRKINEIVRKWGGTKERLPSPNEHPESNCAVIDRVLQTDSAEST
ncbi:hypothetical protein F5Y00DRAFT_271363 [Daldinia vernicosa]|uniref:uncharacterized protein n=1 Tax=Daldinia vernicosa TaxID=114800 RepID=UPI002007C756|nr:uncharacterized protein F5Y00DRAFT_271363 [Daldinia vernicosa]KAI0847263.1 hypothetical protein F5Y00DRAFT_271363 [Daldinia vernicosa]